jgi:hypothetical protein
LRKIERSRSIALLYEESMAVDGKPCGRPVRIRDISGVTYAKKGKYHYHDRRSIPHPSA